MTTIVLRDGAVVPYSKGVTARSIMGAGVAPARAYELAAAIEERLGSGPVGAGKLRAVVESALAEREGLDALARYSAWRSLDQLDRPLVVLLGGTAGVGKSTVATTLAPRLGITRVTSTDTIRHILRTCFSADVMPHVHVSSFEARRASAGPAPGGEDADLLGFQVQTQHVGAAVRAIVRRAVEERTPVILEGVHLVPGVLGEDAGNAVVVHVMLTVDDLAAHRAHFVLRGGLGSRGPADRYLDQFAVIRKLQDHLAAGARAAGVPVIDVGPPDQAVDDVLHVVLETVAAALPSGLVARPLAA